jgi:hypothetical protein
MGTSASAARKKLFFFLFNWYYFQFRIECHFDRLVCLATADTRTFGTQEFFADSSSPSSSL